MTAQDTGTMAAGCAEAIPNDLTRLDDLDNWDVADGYTDPRGFDVMGRDGDKIGTIDALLASPSTEKAYFAVVDTGGWFSSKKFAIPLTMVTLRDDNAYVPLTKDRFQNAPEWHDGDTSFNQFCEYWQPGMRASGTTMTDTAETAGAAYTGTRMAGDMARTETGMSDGMARAGTDMTEADMTTRTGAAITDTTGEMRVPVSEESVQVTKTLRPAGYITLRKHEEEFTRHISEPVTRTEVSVETRDVRPGETFDENTPTLREGETLRVPVMEEQLNVQTTPEQVTREVVIEAKPRTETVEKDVTLRREVVDVDEEGDVNFIPPPQGTTPGAEARR